jgi:hypothetical protein
VPVPQVQGGLTSAQLAAGAVAPAAVSSTGSILGADGAPVSGGGNTHTAVDAATPAHTLIPSAGQTAPIERVLDETGAVQFERRVYPAQNYNMAFGFEAGKVMQSGTFLSGTYGLILACSANTAIGKYALRNLATGNENTCIGVSAGESLNAAGGDPNFIAALNVMIGSNAGQNTTTGTANVFLGQKAGLSNTTGGSNVYIGKSVGVGHSSGDNNIAIGGHKGAATSGRDNILMGTLSGENLTGDYNVAIGTGSAQQLSGSSNVLMGRGAAGAMTTGAEQVVIGGFAGTALTTQYGNVFVGGRAGETATGSECTMVGSQAGKTTSGNSNTYVGNAAGFTNGGGGQNTALGHWAGNGPTSFSNLLMLGAHAGRYANAAGQVFIDTRDRTNIANAQNIGLVYAETATTAAAQKIHLNANVRIGAGDAPVASGLPAAVAGLKGVRGYVTDASLAYTGANIGSTVVGGGANCVPVFCTGTAWVIG